LDATRRRHVFTMLALLAVSGIAATIGQAGINGRGAAPTIRFTSTPAASVAYGAPMRASWVTRNARSVLCSVDGTLETACSSPVSFSGLAVGSHSLAVAAVGRGGRVSVKTTWVVVGPPSVVARSGPSGVTTAQSARFEWVATGATSQVCSRDGAAATACTSPLSLSGLADGDHTLVVEVRNATGSARASWKWTIASTVAPAQPAASPSTPAADPAPAPTPTPAAPTADSGSAPVSAPDVKVSPPSAPSRYTLPTDAVTVTTSAELTAALAGNVTDIILADGTYDSATPFSNAGGHRLYAQNLGKAVLTAGLVMGGNFGAPTTLVQGVVFDVRSTAKVLGGGIVHVWGPGGANARILDCVFRGNKTIPYGVLALNPSGLVLERSAFSDFTDVAARLSDNVPVARGASTPVIDHVSDLAIDGVSRSTPGASNGTAEAGLWIGHPVRNGVSRIRVRNVSWSGIETVNNAWDTRFSDLDIDMSGARGAGVGVYMEHYTWNAVFENFSIVGARTGFNGEWSDPATGGKPGANAVTIRNGIIDSTGSSLSGRQAGVYLDEGTYQTTVTGVTFVNQNWAAIGAYKTTGTNTFAGNTYRLGAAAVALATDHI